MYFFAPKMIKFSHKDSQQRDGQSLPSFHNLGLFFNLNNPRKKNRSYQGCSTPLQFSFALNITFKEKIFPIVGQAMSGRCPFCGMEPPLAMRSKLVDGIECDNCHRIIFE